jgi:hypothetical protein
MSDIVELKDFELGLVSGGSTAMATVAQVNEAEIVQGVSQEGVLNLALQAAEVVQNNVNLLGGNAIAVSGGRRRE